MKSTTNDSNERKALLESIARKKLGIETLETRNMDGLDFSDQAVWKIKEALESAYAEGIKFTEKIGQRGGAS